MPTETISGTLLSVWQERDRLHIGLTDRDGITVADWWDDDARALITDGFITGTDDHEGLVRHCRTLGIIRNVATVYSVDAWREAEGGWTENERHTIGEYVNLPDGNRRLLRWLRDRGILRDGSQGKGMIDECGTAGEYLWVCEKSNRRPVIAIAFEH